MEFIVRKANIKDAPFIAKVIIEADKGSSDKLTIATFFDLTEEKIKELLIKILEEEIDGCEFSLSSFFVAEYNGKQVAALGGWVEGFFDEMESSVLKANLINFIFPQESLVNCKSRNEIIKDVRTRRELGTYQIEYAFVEPEYRGNKLMQILMEKHLENALKLDPNIKKAQSFLFEDNFSSIKVHYNTGFKVVEKFESKHPEVLKYSPFNVRLLLEKELQ